MALLVGKIGILMLSPFEAYFAERYLFDRSRLGDRRGVLGL